jgi:hypothetical protein
MPPSAGPTSPGLAARYAALALPDDAALPAGPAARAALSGAAGRLEDALAGSGGAFLLGDSLTLVDVAAAPLLDGLAARAALLDPPLPLRDSPRHPRLAAWFRALNDRVPAFPCRIQAPRAAWARAMGPAAASAEGAAGGAGAEEGEWREVLREGAGAAWGRFARVHGTAQRTPRVEAAARLWAERDRVSLGGGGMPCKCVSSPPPTMRMRMCP